MFILLAVVTIVFGVLWFFILHSVPTNTQRFLCRHQWLFLGIHIPVMFMLSTIMGEGMLVGVGSLAGGLLGQIYLALHGMRQFGLTFLGKRTARYDALYPPKGKKIKLNREECAAIFIAENMPFLVASALPPHPKQKCGQK